MGRPGLLAQAGHGRLSGPGADGRPHRPGRPLHQPAGIGLLAGEAPRRGTADEKSAWESANNDYESYLEKKLFDKLSTKVSKAHKKLTDWAAEHMTVSPDSPLFELTTKSLQDGAIKFAENGIENVYYGHAFDALVRKAILTATKRAALKSDNPQKKRGRNHPIPIR